jgi:AcrR family transcriptional regulator
MMRRRAVAADCVASQRGGRTFLPGTKAKPIEVRAEPSEGADSRERIFLVAERLFADRGFDGVSVRDIAGEAGVNLAAINYHFGSKSALLLDIFRQRTKELNRERREALRDAQARSNESPSLEDILRALLGPPLLWRDQASGRQTASRFVTRAMSEPTPELRKLLETEVSHLKRFRAALARALPRLADAEVGWALHFALALPHQCTDTHFARLRALTDGQCDTADMESLLARAIRFASGGIAALAGTGKCADADGTRPSTGASRAGKG